MKVTKVENKDDGHDEKAALAEFERKAVEDAAEVIQELTESGSDSYSIQAKLGVLQRVVTAVVKDEGYRQILLLAAFEDKQEAMLAADAITERQRYGVTIQPILDRVIAQCAVKSSRVDKILQAMTTYSLHTNYGHNLPSWKKKQESKGIM